MKKFTVISMNADTGQILTDFVEADDGMQAFLTAVVARKGTSIELVVAIEGEHKEGTSLSFPGDSVVDTATVLEQPEVFGNKLCNSLAARAAVGVTKVKNHPYYLDVYFHIRDVFVELDSAHYRLHLCLAKKEGTFSKMDLQYSPGHDVSFGIESNLESDLYLRSVLSLPINLKLLAGEINRYCSVYGLVVSEEEIQKLVLNHWFPDLVVAE